MRARACVYWTFPVQAKYVFIGLYLYIAQGQYGRVTDCCVGLRQKI